MHENDIFRNRNGNEDFDPISFMYYNSMHEIVHSPISHQHFGAKISSQDTLGAKSSFAYMEISFFMQFECMKSLRHDYFHA